MTCGHVDSDMKKTMLTSISLFVAACGILIARRVCVHGPVRYASSVTLVKRVSNCKFQVKFSGIV